MLLLCNLKILLSWRELVPKKQIEKFFLLFGLSWINKFLLQNFLKRLTYILLTKGLGKLFLIETVLFQKSSILKLVSDIGIKTVEKII